MTIVSQRLKLQLLEVSSTVGIPLFFHHCECNNVDTPASLCKVLATPPSYVLQPCHDQLTFTVFLLLLMRCSWPNCKQLLATLGLLPDTVLQTACAILVMLWKAFRKFGMIAERIVSKEWSKVFSVSSLVISALVSRISIFSLFCLGSRLFFLQNSQILFSIVTSFPTFFLKWSTFLQPL